MYEDYWKLKEKPFENTPDPHFMYFSHEHKEALSRLIYAAEEHKGAAMLTGDYGCGKTVISRMLFEKLASENFDIALVVNPYLSPASLLREIAFQFGLEVNIRSPKTKLLELLNEYFYKNLNNNKSTIIIIDEAQAIRNKMTFEELRLLLNFQLNDRFLLTLMLLGQPELLDKINALPQFKQRLSIKFHLNPLDKIDTGKYIRHRLKVAGAKKTIFQKDSIDRIWENSNGIPRVINNICDLSLLEGFNRNESEIGLEIVENVIKEFQD